jgi:hypothetical protein
MKGLVANEPPQVLRSGHAARSDRNGAQSRVKRASGMGPAEAWFLHLANLAVAVTGIVYGLFRWLIGPIDEFSLSHPWQPAWQHLHILVAPFLVFGIGLIFRDHALRLLRSSVKVRRRSGWSLLACAAPMVLSGYLLQVSSDPVWRGVWMWTHISTSTVWIVAYLTHQFVRKVRSQ